MSDSEQDNAGFIYVLQNNSHDPYIVKVGLTRRSPSKRKAELYQGSSGVPEHFDIAVAISVGDCVEAEKLAHLRLSNYRINPKREFFRIPPNIAMAIAYESCAVVNKKLGLPPPEKTTFDKSTPKQYLQKISDPYDLAGIKMKRVFVNIKDLKQAPIGTSELNVLQIDRKFYTRSGA